MNYSETSIDGSDVAAALAAAQPEPLAVDFIDHPIHLIPRHDHTEVLDLDYLNNEPRRTIGTVEAHTPAGFVRAVNSRIDPVSASGPNGPFRVYQDTNGARLVAVLNDDHRLGAGWRDERVELRLDPTDEWRLWTRHDREMLSQAQFADIIEDGADEIHEPPATVMLDLAQNLQASISTTVKKGQRLADGRTQMVWEEDMETTGGESGTIVVPDTFKLAIRPYVGLPTYELTARLRFRLSSKGLSLGYLLRRPEDVRRAAFVAAVGEIVKALDVDPIEGVPAPPCT